MDKIQHYIDLAVYVTGAVYIVATLVGRALPADSKAGKFLTTVAADLRAVFGDKLPPPPAAPTNSAAISPPPEHIAEVPRKASAGFWPAVEVTP
jgi:hypothetical protein